MPRIFFPSSRPIFVDEGKVVLEIRELAQKAAKKNKKIEAIYLFGSYADGNAGLHSDADILIVLSQDKRKMIDRLDEFIMEFSDAPIPVDVLVYTRAELEKALEEKNRFLTSAVSGIRLR